MTDNERETGQMLLFLRKNLKQINPNNSVSVWSNNLFVNNNRFNWDKYKGF